MLEGYSDEQAWTIEEKGELVIRREPGLAPRGPGRATAARGGAGASIPNVGGELPEDPVMPRTVVVVDAGFASFAAQTVPHTRAASFDARCAVRN